MPRGVRASKKVEEEVVVNEPVNTNTILPVKFLDMTYERFDYLMEAFANRFDDALTFFANQSIIVEVKPLGDEVVEKTRQFEESFKAKKDKKYREKLLFEYIYIICPTFTKFCYKDIKAYTLTDFVTNLLSKVENEKITSKVFSSYEQLLDNKIMSTFLHIRYSEKVDMIELVETLENDKTNFMSTRNKTKTYYTLCYILSERKEYNLDTMSFTSKDEFVDYIISAYKVSFAELNKICKKIIVRRMLDPKLEAWLYSLGYKEELKRFNNKIATNIDSLIDVEEEEEE